MNVYLKWATISFLLGIAVACSPVRFSTDDSLSCQGLGSDQCIVTPDGLESFGPYNFKIGGGKVDILIVDDNSASMSFEQSKMAARFANFIDQLDSRYVDYRIAITTTDIETISNPRRAINQNGSLQNGNLISFGDGSKYLTPQTTDRKNLFNLAISRPETLACEVFIRNYVSTNGADSVNTEDYIAKYFTSCPSTDERGVYAAHLAVRDNHDNFIRNDANLAVILISDEDARSELYAMGNPNYQLESLDLPTTFSTMLANSYPNKTWTFHSIIVKDPSCKQQQSQQILDQNGKSVVEGSYGNLYAQFALNLKDSGGRPRGVLGDICASDYSSQLGTISTSVIDHVEEFALKCSDPISLSVTPAGIRWTKIGSVINFTQPLPIGTQISISYKCKAKTAL